MANGPLFALSRSLADMLAEDLDLDRDLDLERDVDLDRDLDPDRGRDGGRDRDRDRLEVNGSKGDVTPRRHPAALPTGRGGYPTPPRGREGHDTPARYPTPLRWVVAMERRTDLGQRYRRYAARPAGSKVPKPNPNPQSLTLSLNPNP